MKEEFFKFGSKMVSSTFHVSPLNIKIDEISLIRGNYTDSIFPVIFKHNYGSKLTDIIGTGFVSLYLISDKMKSILEENKISGWKTFPVIVYDKKGNDISGYHGFSIIGCCDDIDYKHSIIIERKRNPNGPLCKFFKGIVIDSWDGSDFFSPQTTTQIFVTGRTADILLKCKMTNLEFESLSGYEVSVSSINIS